MFTYPLASNTWDELEYRAILKILSTDRFTMGDYVEQFEADYANWAGSKYAVFCNSGSSANLLALSSLKYDPRFADRQNRKLVIVPSVSWSTTYMPVIQLGYELKFVDIEPNQLNLDPSQLENINPDEVFCIFAVNLLGVSCDYDKILGWANAHNIPVLEDNCESMGAKLNGKKTGSFGHIGTHSTFYSHHMATMEGGICITDDELTYEILKSLRAHGWVRNLKNPELFYKYFEKPADNLAEKFHFVLPGYNFRPTELQAAIGIEQIKKLDSFIENRQQNFDYLHQNLKHQSWLSLQEGIGEPSWFGFALMTETNDQRQRLAQTLMDASIETRPIVSGNMLRQPVFNLVDQAEHFPNAERVHHCGLMIGNHQIPIISEIDHLTEILQTFQP